MLDCLCPFCCVTFFTVHIDVVTNPRCLGRLDCQSILIVRFMLLRMFWDVSSCIEFGVVLMCQSLSHFLSLLEVLLSVCIGSGSVFFNIVFVL